MQKIGIMGGTFDPIHMGHLVIAERAREQYGLGKVLFVPTGQSPLPHKQNITPAALRCEMVALAIAGNPYFAIDTVETEYPGVSYTSLTVQRLRQKYGEAKLYFILGADSLFGFESWHEPEEILNNCCILAAYRKHGRQEEFLGKLDELNWKYPGKFFQLESPAIGLSSGEIRGCVQAGQSIRYLVPREVESYILEHHLYEREGHCDETAGD